MLGSKESLVPITKSSPKGIIGLSRDDGHVYKATGFLGTLSISSRPNAKSMYGWRTLAEAI
jgi:hypothetical protein